MRVAFLSANARAGDAIGNQIVLKSTFFLDRGADVRIFVEDGRRTHPALRPWCQTVSSVEPRGPVWDFLVSADLILVDFSQHFRLLDLLPLLAEQRARIVLDYHGVTPAALWGGHNRAAIEQGAQQRGLVWCSRSAVVHSRFAAAELCTPTGFPAERVVRLAHPVDVERLAVPSTADLRRRLGLEGTTLLLFVGRLAASKRLPILVETLALLRERRPTVHALLVGDDGDLYRTEADRCRTLAEERGVADRLHFLGHVSDEELRTAYQAADVFVTPSRHEGFCIPVLEAMACGVPVIAARSAALPETVGSAGLTFEPDDATDLTRQLERVLETPAPAAAAPERLRVAVVAERHGDGFVGGAERSLRLMAETLHAAGHHVEVFTLTEPDATASSTVAMPVHRFAADERAPERQAAALQRIEQAGPTAEAGQEFLQHARHSSALLDAVRERIADFDAVLAGPYQSGLALDVARAFPERTVLVPCFHDEPAARLEKLLTVCREVGGVLYHSPEERELAEAELGVNVPGALCAGTLLDVETAGDPQRGQQRVGSGRRYLLYCGRYTALKDLPRLLEYVRRYATQHPDRFTFAFTGAGEWPIPREPWARDLGFVNTADLRDVLAGAAALVQLSRRESLSLAALEAWAQGVPVVADAGCAVLAGHVQRGRGGRTVADFDEFAAVLDGLWDEPQQWQERGRQGREYVRRHFGCRDFFRARLEEAIRGLTVPLDERMRQSGRKRAEEHDLPHWRERLARLVEEWLHLPPRAPRAALEIQPRHADRTVAVGQGCGFVPVRLVNRGEQVIVPDGPARVVIRCEVRDEAGQAVGVSQTRLPALLLPGQALPLAVSVPVPATFGSYEAVLAAERVEEPGPLLAPEARIRLRVETPLSAGAGPASVALRELAQGALASAERLKELPNDYLDVTEGWFAAGKRWLKRKLLNNFKKAYVDVVVRQQSAFNQHVLIALHELSERCATLENTLNSAPIPTRRASEGDSHPSLVQNQETSCSIAS